MPLSLEASFFVDSVPDITYRDGLYHVAREIGGYRFECVMRPSVFMEGIAKAVAAARLHCGERRVVPFKAVSGGH